MTKKKPKPKPTRKQSAPARLRRALRDVPLPIEPPAPAVDPAQIADILNASHAAHHQYREHIQRRLAGGVISPGNPELAKVSLQLAAQLRTQAHGLDPQHTAPAWQDEKAMYDHEALLKFYADQLVR